MNSNDLPSLPKQNLQKPERRVKDMQPGERTTLMKSFAVKVDETLHAWVDSDATLMEGGVLAGLSVQVERTEAGIILWLDKKSTFKPEEISRQRQWLPVVEFREAKDQDR